MRIIAGSLGGHRLRAPRGLETRPTADRVREAVFNILIARHAPPAAVLDLFAGSGACGLEALSRGAEHAVFVERHAATARLIGENAAALAVSDRCQVLTARVADFLGRPVERRFGWIFADPPYAQTQDLAAALALAADHLDDGGVVIAEHDAKHAPPDAPKGLALSDRRRYGQTAVSFYLSRSGA